MPLFYPKAFLVINSAMGAGISWDDIATMVAAETAAGTCYTTPVLCYFVSGTHFVFVIPGNPIASIITKLKLDKNRVIIRLPDILAESDSDSEDESSEDEDSRATKVKAKKAFVDVDLDLGLSAYANASKLYSQRKVARSKEQKTAVAAERAIKAVSKLSFKFSDG